MKLKSIISYPNLKSIAYLLFLSVFIGCQKTNDIKPVGDCSTVEVNLSCDRPSTQPIDNIYSLLESHTSSGFHILNKYLDGCFDSDEDKIATINSYINIDENNRVDTVFSLNTVVHELTHILSSRYTDINASYCEVALAEKIWIDQQTEIEVKNKKLFPANEIRNSLIPEAANSLYTQQYIEGTVHASQYTGAYALLNEYNAYYQGLFNTFEFYSAYSELYQTTNDITILNNFVIQFENEILAYYVFKYYIVLYVKYAKDNHPNDYDNLKNNAAFWNVFNVVNQKFEVLVTDYKDLIENNALLNSISDFDNLYNNTFETIEEEIEKIE